jgi:hypothetical protein
MLWNRRLLVKLFDEAADAFLWCQANGLLPVELRCPHHDDRPLKIKLEERGIGSARCRRGKCHKTSKYISIAMGSWFEHCHLTIYLEMSLIYSYAHGDSYEDAQREAALPIDDISGCSRILLSGL